MCGLHSRSAVKRQSRAAIIADADADKGIRAPGCRPPEEAKTEDAQRAWLMAERKSNEVNVLREDINNALKDAMKSGDKLRVSTLRLVNSTLKNADIEARGQGKPALSDDDVLSVLQKMIKQRQESVELYEKGGRAELAAQEREEIKIIAGYLPAQMSEAEVKAAITGVVKDIGASGMKDMGKVMAALKERYAGKMDFGKASPIVKAVLTG